MKKRFLLLLSLVLIVSCLSACGPFLDLDPQLPEYPGVFFTEEILEKYDVSDFPVPEDLENGVTVGDIYFKLKLSEDAYCKYVSDVIAYLKGRDDILLLATDADPQRELGLCVPISETYDVSAKKHIFVFSTSFKGIDGTPIVDATRIEIEYLTPQDGYGNELPEETHLSLCFKWAGNNYWRPYYYEHLYDDGKLCSVPGRTEPKFVRFCKICGQSEFYENMPDNEGARILVGGSGKEHLHDVPEKCQTNVLVKVYADKLIDADLEVTVNGTKLQCTETDDGLWCYEFYMGENDVILEAVVVGGM